MIDDIDTLMPCDSHPVWEELIDGRTEHVFSLFAANMAVAKASRMCAENPSLREQALAELQDFFKAHADYTFDELADLNHQVGRGSTYLCSIAEANRLIDSGRPLHIAGDESALGNLRRGNWIGGTTPYFLTFGGGVEDRLRVLVTEIPNEVTDTRISFLTADELPSLTGGVWKNGFSVVIIPGMSGIAVRYAMDAHELSGLFNTPVIGWIAGVHLDLVGTVRPKVVNGLTGEMDDERLVVMHARLDDSVSAKIGTINLFGQRDGDSIVFQETGFDVDACKINGEPASFYDYVVSRRLDPKAPIVANYSGELINVSFQEVDHDERRVRFYAPVMSGIEYRQAQSVADYRAALKAHVDRLSLRPVIAFNCILNYIYAGLEGDEPIPVAGPATFGEIAYVLLNQTLVYLGLVRREEKGTKGLH